MRLINQTKTFDMPYERCAIYTAPDPKGNWNVFADMDSCCNCIKMASYISEKEAKGIMEILLARFSAGYEFFQFPESKSEG